MLANDVVSQVLMVLDRYTYVAELVHQVDRENAVETMLMYGLPVALRVLTGATVCRAALHDGTVNLFDQRPYEGRLLVVRLFFIFPVPFFLVS
jgi:hypothetical protein